MTKENNIAQRLSESSSPDELRELLTLGTLSAEELRLVESHLHIAEELQHTQREYIPVALKQKLYSMEEPDRTALIKEQVRSNAVPMLSVFFLTLFGTILFASDIRTDTVFILQILFLCSLFGFVFYTLFKSKILRF